MFLKREIMSMRDCRLLYQSKLLPDLFLNNIDIFFYYLNKNMQHELLKNVWDDMLLNKKIFTGNYELLIKSKLIPDKNKDNRYYFLITMPSLQKKQCKNVAIYYLVSFGEHKLDKVRFFLGTVDYNIINSNDNIKRAIFISEIKSTPNGFIQANHGPLLTNMSNFSSPDEEIKYFIERVMNICK